MLLIVSGCVCHVKFNKLTYLLTYPRRHVQVTLMSLSLVHLMFASQPVLKTSTGVWMSVPIQLPDKHKKAKQQTYQKQTNSGSLSQSSFVFTRFVVLLSCVCLGSCTGYWRLTADVKNSDVPSLGSLLVVEETMSSSGCLWHLTSGQEMDQVFYNKEKQHNIQ